MVGADVAAALGYKVGDPIVVSHGLGAVSFVEHDDKPFRVSGVLDKTGTPVDRTVHVSLEAIEAIHVDWQSGGRVPGQTVSADEVRQMDLKPKAITAALLGLKSKLATFRVQRPSTSTEQEPLSAILPGAALQELWGLVGTAETALKAVSAMVVATALLGMVTMILTTLNERRREMAILRSVGARPRTVLGLLMAEAGVLTVAGIALGVVLLYVALLVLQPYVDTSLRLASADRAPKPAELVTPGIHRGRRLSCRPAAGAARLSPVAGGRHDGENMRRGFMMWTAPCGNPAGGVELAAASAVPGRPATAVDAVLSCNGISWCRRRRRNRRSHSSAAEARSISASSAAPTTARPSATHRWPKGAGCRRRPSPAPARLRSWRALTASGCRSAATSCRSTSTRRG